MIFCINTTRDISKLSQITYVIQFRNITRGIYAKYQYKLCYCLNKLYCVYSGALAGAKRAQRSTMAKKIWLSMNPRNFVSDKIVRTYERPPIHVRRREMPHLLVGSFRHMLSVFNLILDIHVT